jgi:hypothetical protein
LVLGLAGALVLAVFFVSTAAVVGAVGKWGHRTFSLVITTGTLTVTSAATLPPAVAGLSYLQTLTATGGVPPCTWQLVSGSWPAGLSMSTAGVISGAPASLTATPLRTERGVFEDWPAGCERPNGCVVSRPGFLLLLSPAGRGGCAEFP